MYVADIYTVNALDIIIYQADGSIGDIWEKKTLTNDIQYMTYKY